MHGVSFPTSDPALIFTLLALAVFLIPPLAARLRLPAIVGLIVCGMVMGPNGGHLLERGQMIDLLGKAGLLYIMFLAGLEIDLGRFLKYRNHSLVFGTITFIIPQVVGTLAAMWLLDFSLTASILLGSMLASHTLLSYPIASRLGIARNTAVTTAVGGTIITDTAALLVLAVIASSVRGEMGVMFWAKLTLFISIFLFLAFWCLPRVGRWFFRTVRPEGGMDFLFVLTMAFLFSWLSEMAGVEAIIGAFVCGLALNPLVPEHGALANRVHFLGNVILIPMFLLSVGMLVNLGALFEGGQTLVVSAVMCVTVIATKLIAAWLSGWFLKYSTAERIVLFGMSVNQAAATLAAVLVGVQIELFTTDVLNGAIMMILVSCMVGPWATERWGLAIAAAEETAPILPGDAPQRILMPLANPHSAEALVDLAILVREPASREPLYPLAVVGEGENLDVRLSQIERLLSVAVIRGSAADVPVTPLTRVDSNIAEGIRRALVEQRISSVIIGWNGQWSLASRVFGTVLDQLLGSSRQMVMVARTVHPINITRRIILVVPRHGWRLDSFPETVRTVKVLASRLTASILVLAPPREGSWIERVFTAVKPEVATEYDRLATLRELPDWLEGKVADDDLLVLVSAREHRLSWAPELDRLPRRLAAKFEKLDFIVVYPSEEAEGSPIEAPAPSTPLSRDEPEDDAFVSPRRIAVLKEPVALSEAIVELVETSTPGPTLTGELSAGLIASAANFPAELREGVVLIHTHQAGIKDPLLFVLITPDGFAMNGIEVAARIVFAVVSPAGGGAAAHLRLLSAVARCVRSEENTKAIMAAEDAKGVWAILRKTVDA